MVEASSETFANAEETKSAQQTGTKATQQDCENSSSVVTRFNLERVINDYSDTQSLNLEEVSGFIRAVTRDSQALIALGRDWDAR